MWEGDNKGRNLGVEIWESLGTWIGHAGCILTEQVLNLTEQKRPEAVRWP